MFSKYYYDYYVMCAHADERLSFLLEHKKLKQLLEASESEKTRLQTEVTKLKKELENFNPAFFEEIEDLKYNYHLEVKKNIVLEEHLKKVCDQFGVKAEMPHVSVSWFTGFTTINYISMYFSSWRSHYLFFT